MEEARGGRLPDEGASRPVWKRPVGSPGRARPILPILLALGLSCVAAAFLRHGPESRAWPGYRSLLLPLETPESAYLEALAPLGSLVLSESTALVELSDFHELGLRPLADAARLLPRDPRRSSYLDSLPSYFRARAEGGEFRIIYIKEGIIGPDPESLLARAGLPFFRSGLRAYTPPSWRILAPTILLLASLGLVLLLPREGARAMLFGLPWLPALVLAPRLLPFALFSLASFLRFAPLLDAAMEEGAFRRSRRRAGAPVASPPPSRALRVEPSLDLLIASGLCLALLGHFGPEPFELLALGLLLIASLSLLPAGLRVSAILRAGRGLRPRSLRPLLIGARLPRVATARRPGLVRGLLGALALLAGLLFGGALALPAPALAEGEGPSSFRIAEQGSPDLGASAHGSLELPLPLDSLAAHPRLEELKEGFGAQPTSGAGLPGIADWLAHRALQEALPLRPLGSLPAAPFESVTRPLPQGGTELLLDFDQAWLRSSFALAPEPSVARLLLDAGVGGARLGRAGATPARPLATFRGILYIFLLALFFALVVREGGGNRSARERAQPR